MKEGISIIRLPYDDSVAWHVQLHASNGPIATSIDFYDTPEHLKAFASRLSDLFRGETCFEVGSDLGRWAYHIYLRAYSFDSLGHMALEILTDNRTKAPDNARVHFAIRCELASVNRLGRQLISWLEHSEEPLQWASKEA